MTDKGNIDLGRRALLTGAGASAGLLLANGGLPDWINGARYSGLSFQDALQKLDLSLSPKQRAATVLPWDHPSRQITNTVAIHRSPHIATLFNAEQVALIRHLYNLTLSAQGQDWFENTTGLEGKLEGSVFKLYSDQTSGSLSGSNTQVMINGGHFMLRSGQQKNNAYAFGGPLAYGQQIGNGRFKVEGNAFKAHGDAVNEFHHALSMAEKNRAYQTQPPMELVTQVQGNNGQFAGVKIGSTSAPAQELAREMLNVIFSAYPADQQQDAFNAIEANGGVESLHVAFYKEYGFYQDGSRYSELSQQEQQARDAPYAQVWRIEGPACVIHFQGYPHVHAYINIVKNPSRMAIGETLAHIDLPIAGERIQALLQTVLRSVTGEALAYYPDKVLGRLSPGVVSAGSIFALEPFNNKIAVVDMRISGMSPKLKLHLIQQGIELREQQRYRIATVDYLINRTEDFGRVENIVAFAEPLRDELIRAVRNDGALLDGYANNS